MSRRPWILVLLAILHILAPLVNLYLNSTWANTGFLSYLSLYLEPQNLQKNWLNLALPIIAGISIFVCRKWSFWAYLLAISGLFVKSYLGYLERSQDIPLFYLLVVFMVNISVVAYFLIPTVRSLYFDPRLRWWEILPRYHFSQQAQFVDQGISFSGEITNFSEGGLFLKSEQLPNDNSVIQISFKYDNQDLNLIGSVIRHGSPDAIGFGVKFVEDSDQQDITKKLAEKLDKNGMLIKHRNQQQHFWDWVKDLSKGKGLLPKNPR